MKFYSKQRIQFQLKEPLGLGSNSRLASLELPTNVKETYVGKTAQIAGFGVNWVRVYEDSTTGEKTELGVFSDDKLRFADVDVLENDECDDIDDSQICAKLVQRDPETPEGVCTVRFMHQFINNISTLHPN